MAVTFLDDAYDVNLAPCIKKKFKEANNEVPDWLEELAEGGSTDFGESEDNREHHVLKVYQI